MTDNTGSTIIEDMLADAKDGGSVVVNVVKEDVLPTLKNFGQDVLGSLSENPDLVEGVHVVVEAVEPFRTQMVQDLSDVLSKAFSSVKATPGIARKEGRELNTVTNEGAVVTPELNTGSAINLGNTIGIGNEAILSPLSALDILRNISPQMAFAALDAKLTQHGQRNGLPVSDFSVDQLVSCMAGDTQLNSQDAMFLAKDILPPETLVGLRIAMADGAIKTQEVIAGIGLTFANKQGGELHPSALIDAGKIVGHYGVVDPDDTITRGLARFCQDTFSNNYKPVIEPAEPALAPKTAPGANTAEPQVLPINPFKLG